MGIEIQASVPVGINAYRHNDTNPAEGYWLAIGGQHVRLTRQQADQLGRYLLFDDAKK